MINQYENNLRRLIISRIGGEDDSKYGISEDRIQKWKEKRIIEAKKNKGVSYENRLIYYSEFYDLKTIILKNWERFQPILKDKKRFEVFFSEVENFRNTIAHGRILTSSQESFLYGITTDLKNVILLYHNKNEMKEDFFIQISKINDNLGNVWDINSSASNPFLRVGDEYELYIEAHDPKNREIEYSVSIPNSNLKIRQTRPRINFTITIDLVSPLQILLVGARTLNSEYNNEDYKAIHVTILPM